MTSHIADHNKWLNNIDYESPKKEEYNYHMMNIHFLQHERLIHLIVMLMVTILLALFFIAALRNELLGFYLIVGIFFVLDIFYIKHYFLLENTVQKWYKTANLLYKHLSNN